MSQRNPMNERYQTDERKGQTRKSAASAKPKTKAASSVRVQTTTKTPKEKKAARKAQERQDRTTANKYYQPDNPEYKRLRKIWWILLIGAIIATALSFYLRMQAENNEALYTASTVILIGGYIAIVCALILDFTKIRKMRKAYQAEMIALEKKNSKKLRRMEEEAAKAAGKEDAEEGGSAKGKKTAKKTAAKTEVTPKKKGIFSFSNLSGAAARASEKNKTAAKEAAQKAAEEKPAEETAESAEKSAEGKTEASKKPVDKKEKSTKQ